MTRLAAALIGLLLTSAVAAQEPRVAPPGEDLVTAIVHVNVIPMDREGVVRDQTVLVRGNRIVGVGRSATVTCVAGVGGSDLAKRIEAIMRNQVGDALASGERFFWRPPPSRPSRPHPAEN